MSKTAKVVLGVIVVLLVLVGGCQMIARKAGEMITEKMIENASDGKAKVDVKDGSMTVTTSEGTFTTNGGKMPDGWPEDVPVYPGSSVQFSGTSAMEAGGGMGLVLMSEDAPASVVTFYKTKLAAEGWATGTTMEGQGSTILIMTKGAKALSLTVTGAEGGTSITMGYQDKAQ